MGFKPGCTTCVTGWRELGVGGWEALLDVYFLMCKMEIITSNSKVVEDLIMVTVSEHFLLIKHFVSKHLISQQSLEGYPYK
jgi:hypothetical protein